ncbi:MAG: hypothetical protein OEZ48_13725 [Candidatus Bathyarchaeota archaeon]|nr:hypothetical protein [Candidatus Bathyarchaeota archaeon]
MLKELEVAFDCSKIRIIAHLVLNHGDSFTKYALVKASRLKTSEVTRQLQTLLELGWVRKYPGSRAETYQANLENRVVNYILDLLRNVKNARTVMEVHQ